MSVTAQWKHMEQRLSGPRAKRIGKWLSNGLMAGVCVYLAVRLSHIGWGRILRELPAHPVFYLVLLAQYLILPLTETLIYRRAWRFPFRQGLPAFIKKRIYNKDVLGYSGEVYLYLWGRQNLRLREGQILGTIKDNNIVSSITSTLFAATLLFVLFYTGQIAVADALEGHSLAEVGGIAVAFAVLGAVGVKFRRRLFHLPGRVMAGVAGAHFLRLVVSNVLQVVQWSVVMPEVDLRVWFTLLATLTITSRIPFLPARDLIFMSVGVGMAGALDVSSAALAGMLGVSSVLDKALNFLLFPLLTRTDRIRPKLSEADQAAERPPMAPEPRLTPAQV